MDCLSSEQIQGFLLSSIRDQDWAAARAHLAACEVCRRTIDEIFSRETFPRPSSPPAVGGRTPPGGWTLGPYRIIREIGRGGQGQVYLAEDERLGRKTALKVLAGEAPDPTAIGRFRREAAALSRLIHPSICTVYEACEIDGIPFIAMRYVDGRTLSRILAGDSGAETVPLPGKEEILRRAALIERVARSLQAAHEAGIIHRDIKPGNIMVTPEGDPVILDLGLVRDAADDITTLTRAGSLLGTPAYMPPELIRDDRAGIDRRADVYSVGATLFECLSGRRPFEAPTLEGLYRKILLEPPPRLRDLNAAVSRDLEAIVGKALEKKPANRYRTALDLAEDLRRVREYEPIRARPAGAGVRFWRWNQRNPVPAAFMAFLILTLALTLTLLSRIRSEREAKSRALVEKEEALIRSEGRRLAALSASMAGSNPGQALLIAIEAARRDPGLLSTNALLSSLEVLRERRTFAGLGYGPPCAARSPDGSRLAAGGGDGFVRIWDISTGEATGLLEGHESNVASLAWSPDGTRIATASWDGTARLWDVSNGRPLLVIRDPEGAINTPKWVGFDLDGRRVLAALSAEAGIWDAASGRRIARLSGHGNRLILAGFLPDRCRVLTASLDGAARVWDAATGKETARVAWDGGPISQAALSPAGDIVLMIPAATDIPVVADTATGSLLQTLRVHGAGVVWASFSPDGKRVLAARGDGTASLWNVQDGKLLVSLQSDAGISPAGAFSADGRLIVLPCVDRAVRIWDAATGHEKAVLRGHEDRPAAVLPAGNGEEILTAGLDSTVRLWSPHPIAGPSSPPAIPSGFLAARFSPEGSALAAIRPGGSLSIIDASSASTRAATHHSGVAARLPAFSGDGGTVLAYGEDHMSLAVWNVRTGERRAAIAIPGTWVNDADMRADGRRIATAWSDGSVQIHDPEGKEILKVIEERVQTVEFSPGGETILTSGSPPQARLRDAATGRILATFPPDGQTVRFIARLSPDGEHVVVVDDEVVELREIATGKARAVLKEGSHQPWKIIFCPSGRRIFLDSRRKLGLVWSPFEGSRRVFLKGHEGALLDAGFSFDGALVVTWSEDRTARVWEASTGAPRLTLKRPEGGVLAAAFVCDGAALRAAWTDGAIRTWPLNPLPLAEALRPRELSPDEADRFEVGLEEERFERFRDAIARLDPDYRKVLLLVRIQGKPVKDVAVLMGRSPDAISNLLARALWALKVEFGETESFHLPDRLLDLDRDSPHHPPRRA